MKKYFIQILYLIFIATCGIIVLFANNGLITKYFSHITKIPFYDKLGHFLLAGILTFIVNQWLNNKKIKILSKKVLLGSLIIAIIITLEELTQIFVKFRTFSISDLLFDYLGILLFGQLANKYHKELNLRTNKNEQQIVCEK